MPRRTTSRKPRQRKPPPGPYDLSTIKLLGGSEMDALATGFARIQKSKQSYTMGFHDASAIANKHLVKDTGNAYIVGDTSLGGPVRGLTLAQLRRDYGDQIQIFSHKTGESVARKAITSMTGMKGRPVNNPPPYMDTTYEIAPGVYISQTKTALAQQPSEEEKAPLLVTQAPMDQLMEDLLILTTPGKKPPHKPPWTN